MTGDDQSPKPSLEAEWRLVLLFDGGVEVVRPATASLDEIKTITERLRHVRWRVERRLVSPWSPVGQTMRTRLVIEAAPDAEAVHDGSDGTAARTVGDGPQRRGRPAS